jgi:hypothetical protein
MATESVTISAIQDGPHLIRVAEGDYEQLMAFISTQYPDVAVVATPATEQQQHQQEHPIPDVEPELRQQVHQALGIEVQMSQVPDVMQSLQQSISASVSARASKPTAASQAENEAATAFLNSLDTVNVSTVQGADVYAPFESINLQSQAEPSNAGALFQSLNQSMAFDWVLLTNSAEVADLTTNSVESPSSSPPTTSTTTTDTAANQPKIEHLDTASSLVLHDHSPALAQCTQPAPPAAHVQVAAPRGFFDNWPSFGVAQKLCGTYQTQLSCDRLSLY